MYRVGVHCHYRDNSSMLCKADRSESLKLHGYTMICV
uniref:Uncharacterized protein n=1 Tax=Anguilla anguilla TaxID=7936 RepID=A0A0E9TMF7_ANGAN